MTGHDWPVWPVHLTLALVLGLVTALALTWSATSRIESAVIAPAHWTGGSPPAAIAHRSGGRITQVFVTEGAQVAAGEALLTLDTATLLAEQALITAERDAIAQRRLRLVAERDGGIPDLPAGTEDLALFTARSEERARMQALTATRQAQIAARITGLTAQQAALTTRQTLMESAIATQSRLRDAGLAQDAPLRALRDQAAILAGEAGALTAAIASAHSEQTALGMDLAQHDSARRQEIIGTLQSDTARDTTLAARALILAEEIAQATLRAPARGQVQGIAVTAGGILPPATTAMTLLPADGLPKIRSEVTGVDVESVHIGQIARITPLGHGLRDLIPLTGRVTLISPAPRAHPVTGAPLYSVEITLSVEELARLPPHAAPRIGLPAQAVIPTGSQPPLAWLIAPLSGYFTKVFRES